MKGRKSNLVKRKKRSSGEPLIKAKKSTFNGIKFDSNLELKMYQALINAGVVNFTREGWTVDLISPFRFTGESYHRTPRKGLGLSSPQIRAMTYTPDFVCIDAKTKTGWVIECKGWRTELSNTKSKLFKQYLTTRGYKVDYFEPSLDSHIHEVVKLIKKKYYD